VDWNTVTTVAALVAAVAAVAAATISLASWALQRSNRAANEQYKERLQAEEHYFKLHLLWQELRIAAVMLQSLPPAGAEYVPRLDGLPTNQLTEALATKSLLAPEAATKVRVARDDLVQLEQMAGDARSPEARRMGGLDKKLPEMIAKTLSSLEQARQAILSQLPA
jgi:hypothetical protein